MQLGKLLSRCFIRSLTFPLMMTTPAMAAATLMEEDPAVSADAARQMLIDGNKRFVEGKLSAYDVGTTRRIQLANGQYPFAVVVTCSDSRVPPELIFDQALGSLFVIRVAGNVLDAIALGSVEYAVEHLNTKLVVVMGHEKCGAVKATVDGGHVPPNIGAIAAKIQPAVEFAKATNPINLYEAATDANIINMVKLLKDDQIIANLSEVQVIGAKYHFESGEVIFGS